MCLGIWDTNLDIGGNRGIEGVARDIGFSHSRTDVCIWLPL